MPVRTCPELSFAPKSVAQAEVAFAVRGVLRASACLPAIGYRFVHKNDSMTPSVATVRSDDVDEEGLSVEHEKRRERDRRSKRPPLVDVGAPTPAGRRW
jgi:hypothetical protein